MLSTSKQLSIKINKIRFFSNWRSGADINTSALNLKFTPVFFGIKTPFYGLD
jgi:hypothetical protein